MASFVAYSRVDAKKHYIHDVLAGALIAGGFTWLFVDEKEPKFEVSYIKNGAMISYKTKF